MRSDEELQKAVSDTPWFGWPRWVMGTFLGLLNGKLSENHEYMV